MKGIYLAILLSLLSAVTLAEVTVNTTCDYTAFLEGCGRGNTDNSTQDYAKRYQRFMQLCESNNNHNQNSSDSYTQVVNCKTSDLLEQEYATVLGLRPLLVTAEKETSYTPKGADGKVSVVSVPTSLNYVTQGFVTSIKNQGSCGCCWSFASTAMYESLLLMKGYSYGLSEEASLECTSNYSPGNRASDCSGGYFQDPLIFLGKVGSVLRSNYPYIAGSFGSGVGYPTTPGICAETNRISLGNGTAAVYGPLTALQIKTMLYTYGPVMVGVYANTAFTQYSSGVFNGCPLDATNYINHAVLLVGYNDATSSWLIKNQWGNWGESGYIRLSYTYDCGLSTLIGKVAFTSTNANPNIIVNDPTLLFSNAKWEGKLSLALLACTLLLSAFLF